MRKLIAIAALGLAVSACSTEDVLGEFNDADVSGENDGPAIIINMPDGFGNLAGKCDGPNFIYSSKVNSSGSARALAVVPNDPRCTGAGS